MRERGGGWHVHRLPAKQLLRNARTHARAHTHRGRGSPPYIPRPAAAKCRYCRRPGVPSRQPSAGRRALAQLWANPNPAAAGLRELGTGTGPRRRGDLEVGAHELRLERLGVVKVDVVPLLETPPTPPPPPPSHQAHTPPLPPRPGTESARHSRGTRECPASSRSGGGGGGGGGARAMGGVQTAGRPAPELVRPGNSGRRPAKRLPTRPPRHNCRPFVECRASKAAHSIVHSTSSDRSGRWR